MTPEDRTTPITGYSREGSFSSAFDVPRILRETSLRHVEFHATLGSTSDTARELLPQLIETAPALVLTARQTAGRGRGTRSWVAGDGALTFSLVLNADTVPLPAERRSLLAIATGVAVHDVLAGHLASPRVRVKWPNDVLLDSRKVCGILTEQQSAGSQTGIVVGVGLNVNNSLQDAPPELAATAASLCDVLGESLPLTEVLIALLNALDLRIGQLLSASPTLFAHLNAVHALHGRVVEVLVGDRTIRGTCHGIDSDGCLVLRDAAGHFFTVRSGTVQSWG